MTRREAEVAWATGLFDGEGSISLGGSHIKLQLKMVDRASVERFAAAVGTPGRVLGPYANKSGERDGYPRRDFFMWVSRVGEAQHILDMLWPLLSGVQRSRALELGHRFHVKRLAAA